MSSLNLGQHALSLAAGLSRSDTRNETASARIASGRRIDRPATDSAALGQAAKLDSEQTRLRAVEVNLQNGVSRLQVTASHLNTLNRIVTRLSELSTLATNPIQSADQSGLYATEFAELQEQLRRTIGGSVSEIGGQADVESPLGSFNESPLFGPGPAEILAIGTRPEEQHALPVLDFRQGPLAKLITQDATGAYTFQAAGADASVFGDAIAQISAAQARVGASQSRLAFAGDVATVAAANHEAALSTLQDADLAAELTERSRLQILTESHTAMLAQARDATAKLLPLLSRR